MITIIEILGRSEQGATRPFLCRADDGEVYYVKGRGAGLRSLCCEWVAGRLGRAFGLALPTFEIATVPAALMQASQRSDANDLGSGQVFASQRVDNTWELI